MVDLRLEQKPELRQLLTPKLIETLKLLILPKVELLEKLDQELLENPMLEALEPEAAPTIDTADLDASLKNWKKLLDGLQLSSSQLEDQSGGDDEENDPVNFTGYEKTLYENLHDQLVVAAPNDRLFQIADFIIGNLDDRGFLAVSDAQILEDANKQRIADPPVKQSEVDEGIRLIQTLSPAGIGARNMRECLMLQLEDQELDDTLAYEIVRDFYEDLLSKNRPQLAQKLDASLEDVEFALDVLSHLSFSPAEGRGLSAMAIEPDLYVIKDKDGLWQIHYNNENIPELAINNHYMDLLKKSSDFNTETKEFLVKKLESAKWWIEALGQRKKTLVNTMEAIIEHQQLFFDKGPENIRPLKMEEIADKIGVHPATISRVVKDKFVQTPYGTFPLRKFFIGGLESDTGEDIATDRVRDRIREIVAAEKNNKPLSDDKIAELLQNEGIQIARRTVTKYRELLGILPARMRKR